MEHRFARRYDGAGLLHEGTGLDERISKSELGMMMRKRLIALALGASVCGGGALAHHSFAVFFDETTQVSVTGTVTAFRFTNPHGTIVLNGTDGTGRQQEWRVETTAPVVLQRRGWTRTSVKPGDRVTVEGWPARDGKPYMRLRLATMADGTQIGLTAFGTGDN